MPEVQLKVDIREHAVMKQTRWGEVKKSLNQDFVFVNDSLAGYYSHVSKKFLPLAGWDDALTPGVVDALRELKKDQAVAAVKAAPIQLPSPEEGEDDE